jgi:hypothetical protein
MEAIRRLYAASRRTLGSQFTGQAALAVAALCLLSVWSFALFRQDNGAACRGNLKQYALALLMYQQDYDEKLPPMVKPAQVHSRVMPYTKNASVFKCPDTGETYLPNPALNYMSQARITAPASTMMLRDAKPHALGSGNVWNVAYADGHVKQVSQEPPLGKPAPMPKPQSRLESVRAQLAQMRMSRAQVDEQIRRLEAEERRLSRGRRR